MAKTRMNRFFELDEITNAIDYLQSALFFFEREDNLKWKWISISLYQSLYSFCIANLKGSNYQDVLTNLKEGEEDLNRFHKRGIEPWKKSKKVDRKDSNGYNIIWEIVDEKDIPHFDSKNLHRGIKDENKFKLLSFWSALARVQDKEGEMARYIFSKPVRLTDEEWKSIEFINYEVDSFLQFIPSSISYSIEEFKKASFNFLRPIEFLSLHSNNILYYNESVKERIKNLIEKLRSEFISKKITVKKFNNNVEDEINYEEIISKGENSIVEFKSCLIGSKEKNIEKNSKTNPEFVVAKTISSFMNSEGGTLFIGVEDNGNIIGIETDYLLLTKKRDKDGYMQKFNEIVIKFIGIECSSCLKILIENVNKKDICIIGIAKSDQPVYVNLQSRKEFYSRFGSNTNLLDTEKAVKYIKNHFK